MPEHPRATGMPPNVARVATRMLTIGTPCVVVVLAALETTTFLPGTLTLAARAACWTLVTLAIPALGIGLVRMVRDFGLRAGSADLVKSAQLEQALVTLLAINSIQSHSPRSFAHGR
jgi:hypothetical protein